MAILIGDIETDNLWPTRIWMVGVLDFDTDEFTPYVGDDVAEGLLRLAEADLCIGHNFIDYDQKHIERLTDGLVRFDPTRIVDTLQLSKRLKRFLPELPNHKLESYGELFGMPKLPFQEFSRWSPHMIPYCERDCRITKGAFELLYGLLDYEASTARS